MTHNKRTPRVAGAASGEIDLTCGAINTSGNKASKANGQQAAPFDWRKHLPIHPAADLFPPMSAAELRTLADDIKKNGVVDPVVFLVGDNSEQLLDGRNRLDALALLGLLRWKNGGLHFDNAGDRDVPRRVCFDDDVDPYALVLSYNVHRRHLTSEQKDDLIAKIIKATPEKSNRRIAAEVKVASHPKVAKVRKQLEQTGDVEKVSTSIDTKGRKQPAKKPAPKPKPIRDIEPENSASFQGHDDHALRREHADQHDQEVALVPPVESTPIKPNGASTVALVSFKEAAATFLPLLTEDDVKEARRFVLGAEWHRGQVS